MRDWPDTPVRQHRRAVFLDRDGTINLDTHYPHDPADLALIPGAVEGLQMLASLPLMLIVVTNQGGIALGLYDREQMSAFNTELNSRIRRGGGRLDAFYYCPHHEVKHLPPGTAPCACSKPSPGMLEEAAREFDLDLASSFLVGDKTSDIAAGERAGCTTVLVRTGKGGMEEGRVPARPDHVAADLYEAALWIRGRS